MAEEQKFLIFRSPLRITITKDGVFTAKDTEAMRKIERLVRKSGDKEEAWRRLLEKNIENVTHIEIVTILPQLRGRSSFDPDDVAEDIKPTEKSKELQNYEAACNHWYYVKRHWRRWLGIACRMDKNHPRLNEVLARHRQIDDKRDSAREKVDIAIEALSEADCEIIRRHYR